MRKLGNLEMRELANRRVEKFGRKRRKSKED